MKRNIDITLIFSDNLINCQRKRRSASKILIWNHSPPHPISITFCIFFNFSTFWFGLSTCYDSRFENLSLCFGLSISNVNALFFYFFFILLLEINLTNYLFQKVYLFLFLKNPVFFVSIRFCIHLLMQFQHNHVVVEANSQFTNATIELTK